jgi:hypothetical protein
MLAEAPNLHEYLTDNESRPSRSSGIIDASELARLKEDRVDLVRWPTAVTSGSPIQPAWYEPTLQAAMNLAQLTENWDRHGAPCVDRAVVPAAMELLTKVMRNDTPAPSVVPTTKGGLQLEWHTRGIDLEVEFLSPVRVCGFFQSHQDGKSWEADLTYNLTQLTAAIAHLSRA